MAPEKLQFGQFTLDVSRYELTRSGEPVRLERIPMDLLILLVSEQGRLVRRDEIIERLWDKNVFFDADNSINTAIRKIRRALGEDPDKPQFIETVPGKGYRFAAALTAASATNATGAAGPLARDVAAASAKGPTSEEVDKTPANTVHPSVFRSKYISILVSLGTTVLLILAVAAYFRIHKPSFPAGRARVMLAVLPFQNLSNSPDQDYFSDGLTEETITDLGEVSPDGLGVIARTSSMAYKNTNKSISRIGSELGVEYVLEGSVRRQNDRVRISAQLIRVKDQTHVWARSYDRELKDLLEVQDDLGKAITEQVQANLNSEQEVELSRKRAVDPEAYDLYLKGRYYWNQRTPGAIKESIRYFQQAANKDPNFASAYSGLAQAYNIGNIMGAFTANESLPKAKEAAMLAIRLDPDLAEAHAALGMEKSHYDYDFPGAQNEFLKAIRINPNSAYAHLFYSNCYLMPMGLEREAIAENQKALELDPLSLPINNFMGMTYMFVGDNEKAAQQFQHTIDMNPNFPLAHEYFSGLLLMTGRYRESIKEHAKAQLLGGSSAREAATEENARLKAYETGGEKAFWHLIISEILKVRSQDPAAIPAGQIAAVYSLAGDNDKAFEWLDEAYEEHDGETITLLKNDPEYRNLTGDRRFAAALRRLGLPQ